MSTDKRSILDCLIIGGGPAGLTAAIYLARYRRNILIADKGQSRANLICESHNYPGFANGISGAQLIKRLQDQMNEYQVPLIGGEVKEIRCEQDYFIATIGIHCYKALKIILATGIVDEKPYVPSMPQFIYKGLIRFCPICDGYEAMNKKIGIMGSLKHAINKALFLRTYSKEIFILPTDSRACSADQAKCLIEAGISIPSALLNDLRISEKGITALMQDRNIIKFDILYPAMGSVVQSTLALQLGATVNEQGFLYTDAHQCTNIENLYAIGDVTVGLSQISVAIGQAALAATHIHNSLSQNFY